MEVFGFFLFFGGIFLFLLGLLYVVFWIWMLIHAITNNGIGTGEKVAWVLVLIFLHVIGPIAYLIFGFPKAG